MASNNEYKRYFIILQEDDKGYEMSPGKIPTGYVKIEVKNGKVKLNAFIQNVKIEDRIEYRLVLVASGKNKAVDVGKIIIDGSGRGELSYELESDNVLKSGLSIGDFTVAAVAAGVTIPLSGYTGRDKMDWKGRYEVVNRQKPQEAPRVDKKITIEEIVPEVPEPVIPEKPVKEPIPVVEVPVIPQPVIPQPVAPAPKPKEKPPVIEIVPEPIPVPIPEPVPEPVIIVQPPVEHTHIIESKVEVEVVLPKCPPIAPLEEPCEFEEKKVEYEDIKKFYYDEDEDCDSDSDSDDDRPKHHEEHHEEHHEDKHHKHEVSSYYGGGMYSRLKKVLRRLRRCEPFEEEKGYNWFKVGDDIYEINSVAVPYMGYMMPMGYPFMSEGCSMMLDRKDYILGVKYDDREDDPAARDDDDRRRIRYLMFGVPAIYSRKNVQYYRSRGYMEYKPHKSKDYGYFIMCLDLRSGMLCNID